MSHLAQHPVSYSNLHLPLGNPQTEAKGVLLFYHCFPAMVYRDLLGIAITVDGETSMTLSNILLKSSKLEAITIFCDKFHRPIKGKEVHYE